MIKLLNTDKTINDATIDTYTAFLETEQMRLRNALPINEAQHILLIHKYQAILVALNELNQVLVRI